MFTKILVPLDGSPVGLHAIEFAIRIANQTGAITELAHVHEPFVRTAGAPMTDTRLDLENRRVIDKAVERLWKSARIRGGSQIILTFMEGNVAEALEQYVQQAHVDIIVMTTRARGGLRRAIAGSVASALVSRVNVPIIFARAGERRPVTARKEKSAGTVSRILIPLDGSCESEQVVAQVEKLAAPAISELFLLRVLTPLPGPIEGTIASFTLSRDDLANRKVEAMKYLSEVAGRLRADGRKVILLVAVNSDPGRTIIASARKHKADMIAMATHGAGAIERMILGSVADKIIRTAEIPALVYRPRGKDANVTTNAAEVAATSV